MTFTGFQGSAGEKRQEQAPIRGTSAIWKSDRGEMARDWLIEDVETSNNFSNGIFLGDHFTVRGSLVTGNGVAGLGGSETVGGLIESNVITGNGTEAASGVLSNGAGMKFTEAVSPDDPLVVHRNEIYQNNGNGVWCDIGCTGFEVIDNYIHDERSRAVKVELSSNAVIRGNLLVNANTWSDFSRDFNVGAITAAESSDVLIEDNYIEGAVAGIVVRQTKRPLQPQENFLIEEGRYENVVFVSERVTIRNNVIVDVDAMGISTGATGRGLIPDPSSIRFEANTYANSNEIEFWWASGDRYSFDQWQASGRDVGGSVAVPERPSWNLTP
jgi:hypothetical protein